MNVPQNLSVVGSTIEFFSGIPSRLVKNKNVIYEISKEELETQIATKEEELKKVRFLGFPYVLKNGSVSSFIDRLCRLPQTSWSVCQNMIDGSYFDQKIAKVGWWGCFTDAGGYANMNREIVRRLHNHRIVPYIRIFNTINQVEPQMLDILNMYSGLSPKKGDHPFVYSYTPMPHEYHGGKRIFFTMMETASLHNVFSGHCNKYSDEIWVPSQSNKDIFLSCGIKKTIKVVPLGIDEILFFGEDKKPSKLNQFVGLYGRSPQDGIAKFKFVNVAQWNFRKGFDALLKSFVNAFDSSDDVCLVFTTQYSHDVVKNDLDQFLPRTENLPQILLYNHIIPTVDMPGYYRNFDCYVHFSRGEGFSLTQIEAAASGLPVISCFHSGMSEYLTDQNSFPIRCDEVEKCSPRLGAVCFFYQDQLLWKLGDEQISQGSEYMKYVVNNYDKALLKAGKFLLDVKSKYTWNKTTERVASLLQS